MLSTITQSDLDRSVPLDVTTLAVGDTVAIPQGGSIRGRYFNPMSAAHVERVNSDGSFAVAEYPGYTINAGELPSRVVVIKNGQQENTEQPSEMTPDLVPFADVMAAVDTIEREVPFTHRHLVQRLRGLLPRPARSYSIRVQVGVTDADEATAVSRVREALEVADIDVLDLAVDNQ